MLDKRSNKRPKNTFTYINQCTIYIALLLFSNLAASGQKKENNKPRLPFEITSSVGGELNRFSTLKGYLRANDMESPNFRLFHIGLGVAYNFNPIIIGISLSGGNRGGFAQRNSLQSYRRAYISTNKIQHRSFIISPEIGIGYQRFSTYMVKDGGEGNFLDFMETRSNQVKLNNRGTALDFALGLKRIKNDRIYPFIRLGYRYGLRSNRWSVENAHVYDAPSDRINNVYLQLLFGRGR
ncbi:hypothetical protein [Sphingobacterium psychroaquaticum]|uniref:Outer membrane protein beta-barrel domain-containing protein n=1 Tax=Sphingobacterium psychroaquaticum TaxID=561061 RepID=A0A1X7IJI0_9SPHI|nr:hypothetical protein [Sphingobacterium psychroaquaticum]SMG14613.1 hypothetical protein SAMN05660862_0878 [Sphingobacterium psychroaquaticum]